MTDPKRYLLNFGCGAMTHKCWTNVDVCATDPSVYVHDLHQPFTFEDQSYDAAYGSHVIEHLEPDAAKRLLVECYRVLKPGGILRVVVPDLEAIARGYLDALEQVALDGEQREGRYDWMMLEMFDQLVRTSPGGRMAEYLRRPLDDDMKGFIAGRIGDEALLWSEAVGTKRGTPFGIFKRVRNRIWRGIKGLQVFGAQACVRVLLGEAAARTFLHGLFRASGENHLWMYDRFSLRRLLLQAGFTDVNTCTAFESRIAGFTSFELDVHGNRPRKPDSLYMEGRRG